MSVVKSKWNLLNTKQFCEIFNGDEVFGKYKDIDIKFPYKNGPKLCELSTIFGLPVTYNWGGTNKSRWQYMKELIDYCIRQEMMSDLLVYLFSLEQFQDVLKQKSKDEIIDIYKHITSCLLDKINGSLVFGGHELTNVGKNFIIKEIGKKVEVIAPQVKIIDRDYISDLAKRANKDIEDDNFDSAITKSRTIVEETFIYVIEQKYKEPNDSGDINKLYSQVKELYNMHACKDMDKRINKLLSGLNKIVDAIAEMRNKNSDSHGVGNKRIDIADYHARLVLNSAVMIADFILSVYQNNVIKIKEK